MHPAMVAQADGSIVRLVHTEEDVDGLYLGTGQKWQLTFCYKTVQTCMYVYAVNGRTTQPRKISFNDAASTKYRDLKRFQCKTVSLRGTQI